MYCFGLLQEWDIVERIRKTKKKLGVTTLLLQLGSIENDPIWSFLRNWVSMRHGGENTFRVSKTKEFWNVQIQFRIPCVTPNVTDLPQLSQTMYSRWRRLPIAADYKRVFLSFLHVHGSNMNGIEVPCWVWKLGVGFWATRPGNTTILRLKK